MYAEHAMVSSKTAEACDTEGKKKGKCYDRKQSKSYSRVVSVKWSFSGASKKREETAIQVLLFKCQLSSNLRTGAEGEPFSVPFCV